MKTAMNVSKACNGLILQSKNPCGANVHVVTDIGSSVSRMSTFKFTNPFYAQQFMDENVTDEQSEYIKKGWLKYE